MPPTLPRHLHRRRLTLAAAGLAVAFAAAAAPPPAPPPTLKGVVTQVVDGTRIRVTVPGQAPLEVRVRDIETPEPCQPGAAEARTALVALVLNKSATLRPAGRDREGLTLAAVQVDEVNVGRRMVEDGWAWSIRTRNDIGPYVKEERMAKALARGVHAQAGAMSPRDWRRTRGPCR